MSYRPVQREPLALAAATTELTAGGALEIPSGRALGGG